jgi:AcrR family transcriptional regulator
MSQAQSRTDPRIERSRLVIRRAALDELGQVGYGAFAIESVAARAGVAKSTIYRHWPDKLASYLPRC